MIIAAAWALLIWLVILLAFGPETYRSIRAKRARQGEPVRIDRPRGEP